MSTVASPPNSLARSRCTDGATLSSRFATVRAQTEQFCEPLNRQYTYLFNSIILNSYYTQEPHCRNRSGSISRPTVGAVFEHRAFEAWQMGLRLARTPQ